MPDSIDDARIRAYCHGLATDLPRGVLGCSIAAEILAAVHEAPARRLPDVTGSAPEIFQVLVSWGLLRSMPSARVMAAALAHIAAISPLVARRSARQWIIRLSQFLDATSEVAEAIRRRVPPALLGLAPAPTHVGGAPRGSSIRAERDQLAVEVDLAKQQAREEAQRADLATERARAVEARMSEAKERADAAELRATAAEVAVATAERRATTAEQQAHAANQRSSAAEARVAAAEERARAAEQRARAADERAQGAEERAQKVLHEHRPLALAAERAQTQLAACWHALGQPEGPLAASIEAERDRRTKAEKTATALQHHVDELRRELAAQRARTLAALEASAGALKVAREDLEQKGSEMREMRARMVEVERQERVHAVWDSERERIKTLLGMEKYDDRVLEHVLRTRLDERGSALRDLEKARGLLATRGDTRPLHELVELMLRRR